MSEDENKELVRQYVAAMERGDVGEAAGFWAPDAVNHGAGRPGQQPPSGPEGFKHVLRSLRTAFPDRRWQIDDLIAEGDRVVCRMTVSGTYGERPPIPVEGAMLMTQAPTGKPYAVQHVHTFRIADGKVAEHWAVRDDLGLLLQLGVLARPPQPVVGATDGAATSAETNKQVVRQFVETIFNQKQTEALGEFMAPEVALHHAGRAITPGLEGIKQHQRGVFAGLPDLHYEIEDMVAEGDRVVLRLTISGTHRGEYWGFAPTGKRVSMSANHVLRLKSGKIVDVWAESDVLAMREQLEKHREAAEPVSS